MMSQQQNPPADSPRQMDSEKTNSEADAKPFSIRQYVLDCRHKNILNNWPFPQKYLQMCRDRGIRDVLPPFKGLTSIAEPLKGCSNLMHSQDDSKDADCCKAEVPNLIEHSQNIKNGCSLLSNGETYKVINQSRDCPLSNEEENQQNCSILVNLSQSADTFSLPSSTDHIHESRPKLASSKAMKRKRGRGKCKKRSMEDILAVARHCTLEEMNRMYEFCYAETATATATASEGCQQMVDSYGKAGSEYHQAANTDMTGN